MPRRRLPLIVAFLLIASLLGIWAISLAGARSLTLSIVDQGANKIGQRSILLLITNVGPYRIRYPDGFFVQRKGTAGLAYVPTTNLSLDPGEGTIIPVALPVITTEWCGVVTYYSESPLNRSKMWLGSTSVGQRLTSFWTSVQGYDVKSPWMSQSQPSGPTRLDQ